MTLRLVRNEEESLTNQFTMLVTLRCTPTQSVLSGFRCGDTSGSTRNYLKANWEEPWTQQTDVSRAPTNRDCASRATNGSDQSATSDVWHKQGEKQQKEDSRKASVSVQEDTTSTDIDHEETWLHFSICACHPHAVSQSIVTWLNGSRWSV